MEKPCIGKFTPHQGTELASMILFPLSQARDHAAPLKETI